MDDETAEDCDRPELRGRKADVLEGACGQRLARSYEWALNYVAFESVVIEFSCIVLIIRK